MVPQFLSARIAVWNYLLLRSQRWDQRLVISISEGIKVQRWPLRSWSPLKRAWIPSFKLCFEGDTSLKSGPEGFGFFPSTVVLTESPVPLDFQPGEKFWIKFLRERENVSSRLSSSSRPLTLHNLLWVYQSLVGTRALLFILHKDSAQDFLGLPLKSEYLKKKKVL